MIFAIGYDLSTPAISNVNRTSPMTANFDISHDSNGNTNVVFGITYYDNIGDAFDQVSLLIPSFPNPLPVSVHVKSCVYVVLQTRSPIGTFRTASKSDLSLGSLEPCSSYWVVVTAFDCTSQAQSLPQLINGYMSTQGERWQYNL